MQYLSDDFYVVSKNETYKHSIMNILLRVVLYARLPIQGSQV